MSLYRTAVPTQQQQQDVGSPSRLACRTHCCIWACAVLCS